MNLQEATVLALQGKLEESKFKRLHESTSYMDEEEIKENNTTKVYNSSEEVPYETAKYKFNSNSRVSLDHYQKLEDYCKNLITFNVLSNKCYSDKWDTAYTIKGVTLTNHIYLNEIAEKYKIETKVILQLNLDYTELVKVENEFFGGHLIYFYKPDFIEVRIEAGSQSCFDSSDRLSAYKKFSLNEIDKMKDFIIKENERISANVNPEDNHNLSDEQSSEAMRNHLMNNN